MNWEDAGWLLAGVARRLKAEWQIDEPLRDTLPSEELEKLIDEWCKRLAQNLDARLDPPEIVKPWILVRLRYAAKICLSPGPPGGRPQVELIEPSIRTFLIQAWHQNGRADAARWMKLDE